MSINSSNTPITGGLAGGYPDGWQLCGGAPKTLAAAGSASTDAALVTSNFTITTGGNGTTGIILPVPNHIGQTCLIYNAASGDVKVYPSSGGTINGGSADANVLQEDLSLGLYIATTLLNWAAIYSAG